MAVAVFPELALSGYAIDDLLLQDALLDAVERAIGRLLALEWEAGPDRGAALDRRRVLEVTGDADRRAVSGDGQVRGRVRVESDGEGGL